MKHDPKRDIKHTPKSRISARFDNEHAGFSTVSEILAFAKAYLRGKGIASYAIDAEALYCHAFGVSRARLFAAADDIMSAKDRVKYVNLVKKRSKNTPIAYITHEREFFSRPFYVDERVLIPRPETETLVERVIMHLREKELFERQNGVKRTYRILDLGCGSGCIAVTLAAELPNAYIVAADVDIGALEITFKNADQLGVRGRVGIIKSRWFDDLGDGAVFDIIVSNPPYIPTAEIETLDRDVCAFEPRLALDGGLDGLDCYRVLCAELGHRLSKGGAVFFEIGGTQAFSVKNILQMNGFPLNAIQVFKDLAGHDRIIFAEKH